MRKGNYRNVPNGHFNRTFSKESYFFIIKCSRSISLPNKLKNKNNLVMNAKFIQKKPSLFTSIQEKELNNLTSLIRLVMRWKWPFVTL